MMSVQPQKLVTTENAWTLALLKNVGSMLSVALGTTEQLASADQDTRATPTRGAGNMSASLTQNVQTTWPVEMRNVSTLVETAQSMPTARPEITEQYASVGLATLEIHMAQFATKVSLKSLIFTFGALGLTLFSLCYFCTVELPKVECTTDRDCPSRQSCLQEKCKDPCLAISPCASNADCTVHNTLPLRTMSCTCIPGYTGKGDERCEKISE